MTIIYTIHSLLPTEEMFTQSFVAGILESKYDDVKHIVHFQKKLHLVAVSSR